MDMKEVIIRQAEQSDLPALLLLCDEFQERDFLFDKDIDLSWSETQDGKKYYQDKVSGEKGICFVAEIDDSVVGYLAAIEQDLPSWRLAKVAEIESFFVTAPYRSQGIGKKLVEQFMSWAKEIKADRVSVSVFAGNEKGIAFYKRLGFADYDMTLEMPIK